MTIRTTIAASGLALLMSLSVPNARAAEYMLAPGDSVQFSLIGMPDYTRTLKVSIDGKIQVPFGGVFTAAGRSVSELRDVVAASLAKGAYPLRRDTQGELQWDPIYPEMVVMGIAEYRPIFVAGEVDKPGMQPFQAGLTVQMAIAMAGGTGHSSSSGSDSINLIGADKDYLASLSQSVAIQAKIQRLLAERDGLSAPDFSSMTENPLLGEFARHAMDVERQTFETRSSELEKSRQALRLAIRQATNRLSLLADKQDNIDAETAADREELRRVQGLYSKGLTQVTSLNEAKRAVLGDSTLALDTASDVASLERDTTDLKHSLEKLDGDFRLSVLADLKQTSTDLAVARSAAAKALDRMAYSGISLSHEDPQIIVTRQRNDGTTFNIAARETTTLMPGDVVRVSLSPTAPQVTQPSPVSSSPQPSAAISPAEPASPPESPTADASPASEAQPTLQDGEKAAETQAAADDPATSANAQPQNARSEGGRAETASPEDASVEAPAPTTPANGALAYNAAAPRQPDAPVRENASGTQSPNGAQDAAEPALAGKHLSGPPVPQPAPRSGG